MNRALFGGLLAVLSFAHGFAEGAPVTMSATPYTAAGVSTTGTLIGAINFNSAETVNGVNFAAQGAAGANNIALSGGVTVNVFDNTATLAGPYPGTGSYLNTPLYDYFVYTNNDGNRGTVTFSGLTPGQQYEVQFFIGENRTTGNNNFVHVYDEANRTGVPEIIVLDITPNNGDGGDLQIVAGSFIADAASQSFFISADVNSSYLDGTGVIDAYPGHLNAFQLRDLTAAAAVPEPASVAIWCIVAGSLVTSASLLRLRRQR